MDLASLQRQLGEQQRSPPVEQWDPAFCGDIDLCIKRDGTWWYQGTPIGRKALVKLFASVLKREGDKYFLVTPVEKVGIQVEDVPFVITQWRYQDGLLVLTTQSDDEFVVDATEHPIELRADPSSNTQLPYAKVRRNLWGRLHQNVFYQLVEQGHEKNLDGQRQLVIHSGDHAFSLGHL